MRWWAVLLAAIGLGQGADARELNSENLRGSIGSDYRVIYAPTQESYRAGSTGDGSAYEVVQTPAHERYEAPYRPVIAGPIAPIWSGFYFGAHFGAGAGTADFTDPFGSSIFGDKVTTPSFLAGAQLGYNWQAANSHW
jgi:hypothetical protein